LVGCCRLRSRGRCCRASTLSRSGDQHGSRDRCHGHGDVRPADVTEPEQRGLDDHAERVRDHSSPDVVDHVDEAQRIVDDHAGEAHLRSDRSEADILGDHAQPVRVDESRAEPGREQRRPDDPCSVRDSDPDWRADRERDAHRRADRERDAHRLWLAVRQCVPDADRQFQPDDLDHTDRERQRIGDGDGVHISERVGLDDADPEAEQHTDLHPAEHDADVRCAEHDEAEQHSDLRGADLGQAVAHAHLFAVLVVVRTVHAHQVARPLSVLAVDDRLVRNSPGIAARPLSFRLSRTGLAASAAVLVVVAGCARVPPESVTPSPTPAASPTAPVTTPTASASPTASATPTASTSPSTPTKPAADKRKGSQLDQPYTVNGIIVVSKAHPVSASYGPPHPTAPYHLDTGASKALAKMTAAAKKAGVRIVVRSGYRSYATQKAVYQRALRNYPSEASAKAYNAPPGASEHQTGLSMDLWDGVTWSLPMANTATGKWLHKHCHEYGFILRYPKGKQKITGYNYEPWHFRYVGVDVARQFPSDNRLTLEEFLGLA